MLLFALHKRLTIWPESLASLRKEGVKSSHLEYMKELVKLVKPFQVNDEVFDLFTGVEMSVPVQSKPKQ